MNKTAISCWIGLLAMGLTRFSAAQSTIYFDNVGNSNPSLTATASGLVWIAVTPESPYTLLNQDLNFELLAGPDADHLTTVATWLVSDGSANGICAGNGQFRNPTGQPLAVLPYVLVGSPVTLEIRAWAGTASTYGHYGLEGDTGPFLNPVGNGAVNVPTLTGMPALRLPPNLIPEPSTVVLAGLALVILAVRHERNRLHSKFPG